MAKLKLWVRNLIISLVLILSVAGVGVGLYFVFQPKQSGTDPDKPKELTPEQRQFISAVSQNEQVDVNPQDYAGLVLDDGEGEPVAIGVNNIVGKFGDYFVTNVAGDIAIYKQDSGSASLTNTTTSQAITLSKVAINTEYDKIYQGEDDSDGYYISGDYAILEKADHSLVIVSLLTGNVVLEQSAFDASEVDEHNPVGSWRIGLEYFGYNFLITQKMVCTAYVSQDNYEMATRYFVYHLGDVSHPIEYNNAENQLLGYEITEDYAQLVSSQKTSVYSTQLGDNGRLALVLDDITNSCTKTTGTAVATIDGVKYGRFEYSTVQFVPNTTFAIVARNYATTEAKVVPDENGNTIEKYDGVFYDDMLLSRVLVGANYRVLNMTNNSYVAGVQLSGKVEAKKSSIDGYIELIENQYLGYIDGEMQISAFAEQTARYFDVNFNEMVSYDYRVVGEVIYYSGDRYYTAGGNGGSEALDVWGNRTLDLAAWTMVSKSIVNSIGVVKHIADESSYELYNVATKQNVEGRYTFASQIMNGKVIVYKEANEEVDGDVSGFYLIDLATMTRSAIVGFDTGSFNLVAGSAGFYFTKGNDEKYTLHFTNGAEDIANIISYDFYGQESGDGIKVPQVIDGKVYVELTIEGEAQKRIVAGNALGEFEKLSSDEIAEKYPITITASNSTNLTRIRLLDKGLSSTTSATYDGNTITFNGGGFIVKIDLSGTIPVYTISTGGSSSDNSETDIGCSASNNALNIPCARVDYFGSYYTVKLRKNYIVFGDDSTGFASCGDLPATDFGGWGSDGLTNAKTLLCKNNSFTLKIAAYKWTVTRKFSDVGVSGNTATDGTRVSDDSVVKYKVWSQDGYWRFQFINTEGYNWNGWSYDLEMGGAGGAIFTDSHYYGDAFSEGGTYGEHGYYNILWYEWYHVWVTNINSLSVGYILPSASFVGNIYVAPTTTTANPGSDYTTTKVSSGEKIYSLHNKHADIDYGFVKTRDYRGSDPVGGIRTDFSGFVKSSVGFTFAGLWQGDNQKIKHDGTFADGDITGDLVPHQYAKHYTVTIHYADGDYSEDAKLPTTKEEINLYNDNNFTATKTFSIYYNQTINETYAGRTFASLWQPNASGTTGKDAEVCAPRGYSFDYLYLPNAEGSGNKELFLTQTSTAGRNTMSSTFGVYDGGSNYFADNKEDKGEHAPGIKEVSINFYAIYTRRSYDWQIDLSDQLPYLTEQYSQRGKSSVPTTLKLHIFDANGTESVQDWAAAYVFQTGLPYHDGNNISTAATNPIVPTMYVSDGETYYQVVVVDKDISFDNNLNRQINNLYSGMSGYTDFATGEDHTDITLKATLKPMQHALKFTESIDDHVYVSGADAINTTLGNVVLNVGDSHLVKTTDYNTTEGHEWTSGGHGGEDKIIYNNFFTGYQIKIEYSYLNGSSELIAKTFVFKRASADITHQENLINDDATNSNDDAKIVFDVDSSNKLTITFYNYYGYYHVENGRGVFGIQTSSGGLNDNGIYSQIIVNAEVSTLPYDISVRGVPYSNKGRPDGIEKIGVVNNSVSEAYNGRYGNDNGKNTEQLGYGSTAVVNIESGLYKHLHNRYYVPDSYVTSIGMQYNAETIFSLDLTGDAEREFSIAMGAATKGYQEFDSYDVPYLIRQVKAGQTSTANIKMIAYNGSNDGKDIVVGDEQLNALLAVLYGRDGAKAKLNYNMIREDSPLLYYIRELSTGVYLITVKYVYNGTDLNVDSNAFGIATAVMFNVDKPWVESNPPTDHTYAVSFVTASISHDLEVSEVGIEDAIGDNGSVKVEWNQNESFAGNYDVEPNKRESYQEDLIERMNDHTTTVDGKRVYDKSFASDYLTFDINAKKGYYVDEVTIVYNGITYTITFEGLTINSKQDEIVFAYKITNTNNADVIDLNTKDQEEVLDNLLFTIKNLAVEADGESTTLLEIVFGFVNQSSSIHVKYGTYTLLRFQSVAESGAASEFAESNYIGYSYDNHGKLVVQKATGAIVNVTLGALQFIDEQSKARLYGLGKTTGDIYTAYDGKGIETRKTEALYFFVKDYSVKGSESKITIETTLNANASYQFGELAGGGYTANLASLANSEHPDTEKTEKIATSTYNSAVNSKNVVSFAIAPKHIKTTIKSDIDFRGGSSAENKVFNETLNGNDKPLDANVLYYVNTAGDTAGAGNENYGQLASTNTTVQYRDQNYEPDHQLTNGLYYVYGSDYGVFGEGLILTIKTVYGYEFTGFTFMAKFGETWYSKNFDWATDKTEDGVTHEICSVSNEGSSRKVGEYLFTREVAADGYVYTFNLQITNLASVEFDVKLHYAAKTFDVEYDTNASFGSSPVAEAKQTRTFVYNVVSDVNYGTAYLQTNINRAGDFAPLHPQGAPSSQNGGVNYTRVGYDQVGWTFGTSNFAKLPSDNQGRLQGQTSNIDNYNNGTTESEPGTLPTAANYENYFYKVGRKDVTDAGYAWYYSLGTSYANVFGSNNLANAPKTTMYAIWNAKDYWMIFDYNDSINNHGSSLSSKIYATWVFDQTINVENEASADLKFDNPADRTNKLSNVYRLGYTFDGWYFVEGTFNGTQHWNADYLIYANDYQNKPANFVTGQGTSTAKLEYAAYQKILEQTSWAETQDEYDESQVDYSSRHARTDANRSRVFLYAKWTANVYTFEYDLNAVSGNDNNYKSLAWNNGTLSKTTAAGMGSSAASLAESDKTIVEVVFDTKFSDIDDDWFKTYAYRYGYRFTGWYATRYAGTGDPGLLENSTLDKDLLVYLTNYTDKYESNTWGLNIASADEIAILQSKAAKTLSATNIVDSVDVDLATHVATNDSVNNKILLHARWTALEYTMNIDLNNEGHIDYAWEDADYAVAGAETGNSKHFVSDNWIKFSVLFDQKFETGNLVFGNGLTTQDIVIVSSKTEMYQIYDNGGYVNKDTVRYKVRFSQYSVAKETTEYLSGFETLTGIHTELLNYPGIIYSYGYNLGLNDGSSTYYFTLTRDTLGFEKKADIDAKSYPINGDTVFDEAYLLMSKFESTLDGNKYMPSEIAYDNQNEYPYLKTIDNSGSAEHHVGDMHKQSGALEAFGQRNLTLFAYWTQKDLKAQNNDLKYSTSEQYNNSLRNNNEQAIATQGAYAGNPTTKYDKTSATETTLTFFAPNGQYVSELYIDIYDDRLEFNPNDTKENRKAYVGRLTLYFTWDSVTRTVHIGKNNLIGIFNIKYNFAGTSEQQIYIRGNEVSDGLAENIAHSFEYNSLLHYLAQALKIETSVYKTNQAGLDYWAALDAQGKNINTSYAIQSTPVEEGSNYDINIVTLTFTSLKSNFVVSAKNLAQTYQIDYYRYIRPVDGYSTKLDDNGIEYWDGTFYNDWDQYLAYQKLTYRYGEYASMNYGYASNFAFENWYYYQGHAYAGGTFEEYANYDHTGAEAYETHQSVVGYDHLLDEFGYWTEVVYTWIWNDESDHSLGGRYEREYTEGGETKIDVYGTTRIGDNDTLSLHQYHRYTQAEGKKFIDNGELVDWGQGYYNNLTYKFDRNPIRGNTSLICLYVPSAVHRVHYYSWDVSGGYVDRTASSREYILGEKKTVEVHGDVVLGVGSATVETWILGNNSEYYYVGFSGINKFNTVIDDAPTLEAAYAFLVQFMNCTKTPVAGVEIINSNRISINWNALQAALDSGIVLNGKEYATEFGTIPEHYAKELLQLLVQEYSVVVENRVYGFNGTYLADAEVIKNMTFYDGTFKHDLDEIEAEIPAILWYEAPDEEEGFYYISNDHVDDATLPTDDTTKYLPSNYPGQTDEIRKENAYNAALAVVQRNYKKAVFNLVAKEILTTLLLPAPQIDEFPLFDGSEEDLERIEQLEQLTIDIVDKLKIKDLNILLNSISSDYFGFVLKNPSSVVNVYPSGDSTYFAGWYLVDAELATYLDTHRDTVLTFNSDTWNLDSTAYRMLYVSDEEYHEEDGTRTYTLSEGPNKTGKTFIVSRFHTVDQLTHAIDKLSRVENEITVYAAFNCYRFEFKQSGTDFVMTTNELQWGSRRSDLNGDPYQYRIQDVTYYALSEEQYNAFAELVKDNNNLPTSLQTIINRDTIKQCHNTEIQEESVVVGYTFSINDNLNDLAYLKTGTWYIIACVYNVDHIEYENSDPEKKHAVPETDDRDNKIINMVSNKMIVVSDGSPSIATTGTIA